MSDLTSANGDQPRGLTRTDILTPDDVAELLSVTRRTVMRKIRENEIPAFQFGRQRRILRKDVEALFKRPSD